MRRSFKFTWLYNQNKELCGINLGADYCSEHELGISELISLFGTSSCPENGISDRTITRLIENLIQFNDDPASKKVTGMTSLIFNSREDSIPFELKGPKPTKGSFNNLSCAWDSKSFGIVAHNPLDRANLVILYESLKNKDFALWTGNRGIFQNNGLILGIPSKIDEASKKIMLDCDLDQKSLNQASLETGIVELLNNSGLRYYCLTPKWANSIKSTSRGELITKYKVVYFLNPLNQSKFEFGWFTVEELTLWSQNIGPIIKK